LDDLEEDAIPDDPLEQQNSIITFEFFGSAPKNPGPVQVKPTADNINLKQADILGMYSIKGKSKPNNIEQDAIPNVIHTIPEQEEEVFDDEAAPDELELDDV